MPVELCFCRWKQRQYAKHHHNNMAECGDDNFPCGKAILAYTLWFFILFFYMRGFSNYVTCDLVLTWPRYRLSKCFIVVSPQENVPSLPLRRHLLRSLICLNDLHLGRTPRLMVKLIIQPFKGQLSRQLVPYHLLPHTQDLSVIAQNPSFHRVAIMCRDCTDSVDFVGCDGNSQSGAAD
jgi:hypothetical protein